MQQMLLSELSFPTPFLNLAFEEWYFARFEEETLRLWVNPTAVVVGKHQNALAECDMHYCVKHDIPIIRRISGGGTVFHDEGNVNFSFFRWVQKERMIDYDRSLEKIRDALRMLGYPVEMNERHDLFLEEKKVSGNAQHLKKGRSLHHGTILYDANLELLRSSIKRSHGTFEDKSVQSVRSPIANLRAFKDLGTTPEFLHALLAALLELGMTDGRLPKDDSALATLQDERYTQEHWNFGYSPRYIYRYDDAFGSLELHVERGGEITECLVRMGGREGQAIAESFLGKHHFWTSLQPLIQEIDLEKAEQSWLRKALF